MDKREDSLISFPLKKNVAFSYHPKVVLLSHTGIWYFP